MAKKVLKLVSDCKDCPNRAYYSAGRHECTVAGTMLPHGKEHQIPDWCPLADYPSDHMERQRETIETLRKIIEDERAARAA